MIEIDWNPDQKKLRQFGVFALFGFPLLGLVLGWKLDWLRDGEWTPFMAFVGLGGVCLLLAIFRPGLLKPVYWVMTGISSVIGPVIGTLVLLLVFLFVFLPIGCLLKLRGHDELKLKPQPTATTYWQEPENFPSPERYFHQY